MQSLRVDRYAYLVKESILFLAISFLLLLSGSTNGLLNPDLQKGFVVLISLIAAVWVVAGQKAATPAGKALLIWIVMYLIVVFNSDDPRRSMMQMELMGVSIFLFVLSADLVARGWPRELIVKALLMVGAVIMLMGWAELLLWYLRWLQTMPGQWLPDVTYRLSGANLVAMFLNLVLMLAGARLIFTKSKVGRITLTLLVLSSLGLLYFTSSRGGWLGTAAGLGILVSLSILQKRIDYRRFWAFLHARPLWLAIFGAAALAMVGILGVLLYKQTIHPSHGPVFLSRSEYWPPAWETFLKNPLLGSGPFTYAGAFLAYNSVPQKALFVHAHSTILNSLAEIGLLGVLALAGVVSTVTVLLWWQFRTVQGEDLGVIIGGFGCLAAVGVHSFFDCFHAEPLALWIFVIIMGCSLGRTGSKPRWGRFQNAWFILLPAVLWVEIWVAAPLHLGVELANSNRLAEAALSFDEAVIRDPASVIAYQQRALANSVLASQGSAAALDQATADLEVVTRHEPAWAMNHANLGALYLAQGRADEAAIALQESLHRAPEWSFCALNLGAAQEAQGKPQAAVESYTLALTLGQPSGAYFWRSTPLRQQAYERWLARQAVLQPSTRDELVSALAGNTSTTSHYLSLARLYLAENRLAEAEELVRKSTMTVTSYPSVELDRQWMQAEILAARGELYAAVKIGDDVLTRYGFYGIYGPGSFGRLSYAPLMFRKPSMALEIMPQVIVLTLPDEWGAHAALLANWHEDLGNTDRAAAICAEVRREIPDFDFSP